MVVARPGEAPVWKKMGLLFTMYILQNISLGFTWCLLPILMRKQGFSLGAIGLTALIYSPWALKFLWASQVDRRYSLRWGRRKSWIMPLTLLSLAFLAVLALMDPSNHLVMVLAIVFCLNINIATTDIAVDGYATDILSPKERSWGNTTQMTGYLIGHTLGSGVFLIIYQWVGWAATLWIMAGLHMLLMVPVLAHREIHPVDEGSSPEQDEKFKPSARAFLRLTRVHWFLLFLFMVGLTDNGGNQLRLTMLADAGLDPSDLGQLLLWIGSPYP